MKCGCTAVEYMGQNVKYIPVITSKMCHLNEEARGKKKALFAAHQPWCLI